MMVESNGGNDGNDGRSLRLVRRKRKKDFVRSGIRTHARIRGPEHPLAVAGKDYLESGALDHSAILTTCSALW